MPELPKVNSFLDRIQKILERYTTKDGIHLKCGFKLIYSAQLGSFDFPETVYFAYLFLYLILIAIYIIYWFWITLSTVKSLRLFCCIWDITKGCNYHTMTLLWAIFMQRCHSIHSDRIFTGLESRKWNHYWSKQLSSLPRRNLYVMQSRDLCWSCLKH